MKNILSFTFILIAILVAIPSHAADTTTANVRQMCTAPDNQNFSAFDQNALPGILIDIIRNDPPDAPYHERVVTCALKQLGSMHVPEAVPVLIEMAPQYPAISVFWLGTFSNPSGVDTIVEYLDNENPSIRYEAAVALGKLPEPLESDNDEYIQSLIRALAVVGSRITIERDPDVSDALQDTAAYLIGIAMESGTR